MLHKDITISEEMQAHIKQRIDKFSLSGWVRNRYTEEFMGNANLLKEKKELIAETERKLNEINIKLNPKKANLTDKQIAAIEATNKAIAKDPDYINGRLKLWNKQFGMTLTIKQFKDILKEVKDGCK